MKTKKRESFLSKLRREKPREWAGNLLFYFLGSTAFALSVNIFTVPNHIAPGGVTGIATVLNYLFPQLPIGFMIFLMNIPILTLCWFFGGRMFTLRTLICTFLSSAIIDALQPFLPVYEGELMLAALFGGVFSGVGLGLIYMRGACTGGSEAVARMLEKRFPHIPIGRLILILDAIVIMGAAVVYQNVESALYAIVSVYVSSKVMDTLVYGGNTGKMVMIISEKEEEITQFIIDKVHRGVTKLESEGGFSGQKRKMLLCAVGRTQMYSVRRMVAKIDPNAFIIVTSTDDVLGEGFRPVLEDPNK